MAAKKGTIKKTVGKSSRPQNKNLRRGGPGRPKGSKNKATIEAKKACAEIVDDPAYRENLIERARNGKLAPAIEAMLWHYAKGKPKEYIEHTGKDGSGLIFTLQIDDNGNGNGSDL